MLNNYVNRPRRKAFLGSITSEVIGIGSSIYGGLKQKEAQEKQYRLQRNTELRNVGLTSAGNLSQTFSNANELDEEFRNRFLRCGGRVKAENGGSWKWSDSDTSALINGLSSAGSNLATSLIGKAQQQGIYPNAIKPLISNEKDNEAVYDSAARSSFLDNYYRTTALRMGGRKCRR